MIQVCLKAKIQGSAISEIEILETPVGLNEVTNLVFAENNDNGIGINSCFTNTAGIVTCFLATPISGFTATPFAVGDKVFVEGIVNIMIVILIHQVMDLIQQITNTIFMM